MSLLRSLKNKIDTASQLSFLDWLILVNAWFILFRISFLLRISNLQDLQQSLSSKKISASNDPDHLTNAWHLQKLVYMASRLHLPPSSCFIRACTLQRMLSNRGIPSTLRIGTNRSIQEFHAHAWIEVQGQAVGEPQDIQDSFELLNPHP